MPNEGDAQKPMPLIVGFPEFRTRAYRASPELFDASVQVQKLVNEIVQHPVRGQLPSVLRLKAKEASNSLHSTVLLASNGCSFDAIRISRGMYESAVDAAYLRHHPDEIEDYLEYHWVLQKRRLAWCQANDRFGKGQISSEAIEEINREFERVKGRFAGRSGRPRSSWCSKSIRDRAEGTRLEFLYDTFYRYASDIHHGNFGGLAAQVGDSLDIEGAPSLKGISDALVMALAATVAIVDCLNDTSDMRMDADLDSVRSQLVTAFEKVVASR